MGKQILGALSPETVQAVASGEALAIRVPKFLHEQARLALISAITTSPQFSIDRTGFVALGQGAHELEEYGTAYFTNAGTVNRILQPARAALEAALGPLNPPQYKGGGLLRPLVARRYLPGFEAAPHQDQNRQRFPWAEKSVLSVMLNLVSPTSGGVIDLWDLRLSPEQYASKALPGSQGRVLARRHLLLPDELVQCADGELFIFDELRVHAVRPIDVGSYRLTVDGFFSVNGDNITTWS